MLSQNNYPARRKWRLPYLFLLLPLLLYSMPVAAQSPLDFSRDYKIAVAWSAMDGHTEQTRISLLEDGQWTIPAQISECGGFAFQPTVAFGTDDSIYAAWVCQADKKNYLEFAEYSPEGWSKPGNIKTNMISTRSPTIIIDPSNSVWLAWSGVETTYPDIFWSRKKNQVWEAPQKAHTNNNVPELSPLFRLDANGEIILSWLALENDKYINVSRFWNGSKWETMTDDTMKEHSLISTEQMDALLSSLEFDMDLRKASLFIKGNKEAVTIPLSRFHTD